MTITPATIEVDRKQARELYQKYKAHVHYSQPIDREIQRTYQLIAQGRMVIRALESIKAAGVNDRGLPVLAILRADFTHCHCDVHNDGRAWFGPGRHHWRSRGKEPLPAPGVA